MEDKKNLYAEEVKNLGIEDLDSVSGGGGDYISKRLPKEVAKEYLRTRSKHVQVTEDYINKKISKEEYDAACREFREYKKNLKKSMAFERSRHYYNIFVVNTPNIQLGCYPSRCLSC